MRLFHLRLGVLTSNGAHHAAKRNIKLLAVLIVGHSNEERPMKLKTIVLAGAFALSSSFAFAQAGGASSAGDAAMPEKSGSSTNSGTNPSAANSGSATSTGMNGPAAKPGGPDKSKPGGESTERKANGG